MRNEKENKKSRVITRKPTIISCIREESAEGRRAQEKSEERLLSLVLLEEKKKIREPLYLLKKRAKVNGLLFPVLDVLDTRNTYLWIEMFKEKRVEHRWDEETSRKVFNEAISKDILEKVVGNAGSVGEAIERIYQRIYSEENLCLLKKQIRQTTSSYFDTLISYKNELSLLLSSLYCRERVSRREMRRITRKWFWRGLSSSIKDIVGKRISRRMSPDEIIEEVNEFKREVAEKYEISEESTQAFIVKRKSAEPQKDTSKEKSVSDAVEKAAASVPTVFSKSSAVFKIFTEDRRRNLEKVIENFSAVENNKIFSSPVPGEVFLLDSLNNEFVSVAILYQKDTPISAFVMKFAGAELAYTEVEKEIVGLHTAQEHFKELTKGSPVFLNSTHYRSFRYTKKGTQCIDEVNLNGKVKN